MSVPAALPETLKIMQVMHDTVYVVVRDTVVRVAEPLHEPVRSEGFFGKMSPFDVIVAVVALLNGAHTLLAFLRRARVDLHLGDHVGVVLNPGDVGRKLHLRCNLVNPTSKTGTVHHLEVLVRGPQSFEMRLRWHLFYEYLAGGQVVQQTTDVHPISVLAKDSHLEFIEFEATTVPYGQRPPWAPGRYTIEVEGWVNQHERAARPNLRSVCHINVEAAQAVLLQNHQPAQPTVIACDVEEWRTP